MLVYLADLAGQLSVLNVFRYITFRTGGAVITALLFVFLFGPAIISSLRIRQGKGQPIREDGPKSHLAKKGTPTMGGLMILSGILVATLLWADLKSPYVWTVLLVTVAFGSIGFLIAVSVIVVLVATTVGVTMPITGLACPRRAFQDGCRPIRYNQRTLVRNLNRSITCVEGSSSNHVCGRKCQKSWFYDKALFNKSQGPTRRMKKPTKGFLRPSSIKQIANTTVGTKSTCNIPSPTPTRVKGNSELQSQL